MKIFIIISLVLFLYFYTFCLIRVSAQSFELDEKLRQQEDSELYEKYKKLVEEDELCLYRRKR